MRHLISLFILILISLTIVPVSEAARTVVTRTPCYGRNSYRHSPYYIHNYRNPKLCNQRYNRKGFYNRYPKRRTILWNR